MQVMSDYKEKFFLGSFSPDGFRGDFQKVISQEGYRTIILKGGAGTGKSSLMKAVSKAFEDCNGISEYYCSSDPKSLDAVVLKNRRRIIVDGTAPHVFDPIYPAVSEKIINLGDCWNENGLLPYTEEIIKTTKEHQKLMARTKRYVSAVSSILTDTYQIGSEALLKTKLDSFIKRLVKKLALKKSLRNGEVFTRQLSALTPDGYKTLTETLDGYEVYLLRDGYFAASDLILSELTKCFTQRGTDVYVSPLNIFPTFVTEHILVPRLNIAFVTANPLNSLKAEGAKLINADRFYDKQIICDKKSRLKLNKKAVGDLASEASASMKTALRVHDGLEKFYIGAMDFEKVSQKTCEIIEEFR